MCFPLVSLIFFLEINQTLHCYLRNKVRMHDIRYFNNYYYFVKI